MRVLSSLDLGGGLSVVSQGAPFAPDAIAAIARLRIEVFRAWPYLYDGDPEYEARYLERLVAAPGALLAVARLADPSGDSERVVGAATVMPLADADAGVRAPFEALGADLSLIAYFGESVLEPGVRGRGVGHVFFDVREAHARALGAAEAAFCAVDRAPDDPCRDPDARDLTPFWRARGYAPREGLACQIGWREVGAAEERPHRLTVWSRRLDGRD